MVEALQMISEGRLFDLRWFLDERLRERGFPRVNWVKIANIRFFCEFRRVVEAYEREGKIAAFVREAIAAVQNGYFPGQITSGVDHKLRTPFIFHGFHFFQDD